MTTRLTVVGDSLALVLDKSIWDRLGIDRDTLLSVKVEGGRIVVDQATHDRTSRVLEAAERVMDEHAETLRKLAL